MNYRKLLEEYQQNKLNEEQKAMVEADIDRQEAISDYLFDRDRADFGEEEIDRLPTEPPDEQSKEFVRLINRTIRRTLMKIGIAAAVLVAVIFLAVPPLLSLLYYNPAQSVGLDTNRLSRDWAIWSEVNMPGNLYDSADVRREGAGRYSFTLHQSVSHTGTLPTSDYAGRIDRGQLQLYTPAAVRKPSFNLFANAQLDPSQSVSSQEDKEEFIWAAGDADDAWEELENLDDSSLYNAYISFEKPLSLSETREIVEKELDNMIVWYAVQPSDERYSSTLIGMRSDWEGIFLDRDDDRYPWLFLNKKSTASSTEDEDDALLTQEDNQPIWQRLFCKLFFSVDVLSVDYIEGACDDEEIMTTHFVSMLRYLSDQKRFLRMMDDQTDYTEYADYVEQNGLHIYGIMVTDQRDNLLQLKKDDRIYGITTEPAR